MEYKRFRKIFLSNRKREKPNEILVKEVYEVVNSNDLTESQVKMYRKVYEIGNDEGHYKGFRSGSGTAYANMREADRLRNPKNITPEDIAFAESNP